MDPTEAQIEEIETLASIYEGDHNYKQISVTNFQYKVIQIKQNRKVRKKPFNYSMVKTALRNLSS